MNVSYMFDGGGSHNGSPAGWGWACGVDGREVGFGCGALPPGTTNNVAEYTGLIMALKYAIAHPWPPDAHHMFRGDSLLVVRQVHGQYRVKAMHLQPLRDEARMLLEALGCDSQLHLQWHERASNARADMLATEGRGRWREQREPKVWARGVRRCSARESHWCPRHGTCVCTEIDHRGHRAWARSVNPQCPLHGPGSTHPIRVKIWSRRP